MAGIEVALGSNCTTPAAPAPIEEWIKLTRITGLLIDGLTTDGAHHKQWYLEQVLRELVPDEFKACKSDWGWETGVAP